MPSAVIVADTSVLLNFIKIDRMDLIGLHPRRFLATDHVEHEIDDVVQRARLAAAVAAGHLDTCIVDDPREVELFLRLAATHRLGLGECSAIAVARNRGYALAIDDNKALNRAFRAVDAASGSVEIVRTADVMVGLIRAGVLTVAEADRIKDDWARRHRFRIKAASFGDLV